MRADSDDRCIRNAARHHALLQSRRAMGVLALAVLLAVAALSLDAAQPPAARAHHGPVIVDSSGDVGSYTAMALDSSGRPVISYYAPGAGLKVVRCGDANCTSGNSITTGTAAAGRPHGL